MPSDPRPKCNRCNNKLSPVEATRDREKAGYVHKGDCPPRPEPRPSIGQQLGYGPNAVRQFGQYATNQTREPEE